MKQRWFERRTTGAVLLIVAVLAWRQSALACDLCAVYMATEQRESRMGVFAGLAEQYTHFDTVQHAGEEVPKPGERLQSFITQIVAGYSFTPRLAVQVNIPLIARDFRRQHEDGFVSGDESGLGDLSLVAAWTAYTNVSENMLSRLTLLGGLKLPSGNSRRIKEELVETHEHESAIHGHDLALGSGSVDGILGAQLFWAWRRAFLAGGLQYVWRTEGDFEYEYANDLMWNGGPGVFMLLGHNYTVGLQAELTGESKGNDTLAGMKESDTAITSLYMGPDARFTWGTSLGANLAVDLPVLQHTSGLQIVPDYRLRAGFTWRF